MSRDRPQHSLGQKRAWLSPFLKAGLLGSLVCSCAAGAGCTSQKKSAPRQRVQASLAAEASTADLPAIRQAGFRNAESDAAYVGSQACTECHAGEYDSYLHTTHSRALSDVDPEREPPDAELTHAVSGRSYRVYRENGQLRHREFLMSPDGEELVLADHAMRYAIGSGNHSRSYLLEIDGFLFESPLTWYASRESWDVSPGYEDDPMQRGFSRATMRDCIICHAGQAEPIDHSLQKLAIHEMAIGCERCHGPGALHVARRRADQPLPGGRDDSIVHPARLSRELQESICGQCHLSTVAEANVRGRSLADFRPSLHLTDFRVHYRLESQRDDMAVVGHVEQMRASRCYQKSPEMTCTTCHSMHAGSEGQGAARAGRESCMLCHTPESCGMAPDERVKKSADDNCLTCHMPESETNIAHFVFRHHRVGLHMDAKAAASDGAVPGFGKLVPIGDLSHLPPLEEKRCRGLAYSKFGEKGAVKVSGAFDDAAAALLEAFRTAGMRDSEVDAALALVYLRKGDTRQAVERGQAAMLDAGLVDEVRGDALGALTRAYMNERAYSQAEPLLNQLIRFRYNAQDHLMLSIIRRQSGDLPGALQAARAAVNLEPHRFDLHEAASQLYTFSGDLTQAAWHRERARRLQDQLRAALGGE